MRFEIPSLIVLFSMVAIISCTSEKESDLLMEIEVDCSNSTLSINIDTQTNPSCTTGGSITTSASGGEGDYVFMLQSTVESESGVFEDLQAGTYVITVEDEDLCVATSSTITLEAPGESIQATVTATASGCETALSTITVIASGGDGSYAYALGDGESTSVSEFTNQGVGSYSVTVADGAGCEVTTSVEVLSGVSLVTDVMPIIDANCATNSTCHGAGGSRFQYAGNSSNVISRASSVNSEIQDGSMPKGGTLTANEKALIACWVEDGAPNN